MENINQDMVMKLWRQQTVILEVYGPTDDKPEEENETKQELILASDLNGRRGTLQNSKMIRKSWDDRTNRNGEEVTEICETKSLETMKLRGKTVNQQPKREHDSKKINKEKKCKLHLFKVEPVLDLYRRRLDQKLGV